MGHITVKRDRKLITADLHCSDNARDDYRFRFLEKILPNLLSKHKIDTLYILGDLTEVKNNHSARLVNRIADALFEIAEVTNVDVLMGNHDYTELGNPFFRFLSLHRNMSFHTVPLIIGDEALLPHTRHPEKDWKGLSFKGVKRIFTHQTFKGAVGGFGRELDGFDLSLLPNVEIVSGDVHVPQDFKNLVYVGAPWHVDFGDDYQGRVLVIDEYDKVKSIEIHQPQKRIVRAEIT